MRKTLLAGATVLAAQTIFATIAGAATCADRTAIVERLENRYSETLAAVSAPRNGAVLEVFTSEAGATWTVMMSFPEGLTCHVASGRGMNSLQSRVGPRLSGRG